MSTFDILSVGLMSGTSADGIDAALVRTDGESRYEFLDFCNVAYSTTFKNLLLSCAQQQLQPDHVQSIENQLTELHAQAVKKLLRNHSEVPGVIGFHGHTILHDPANSQTKQLGDGQRLAAAVNTKVVHDFRSADIQAGGQGAPLVPLFHQMMFEKAHQPCVVLNIGGVANITWLDNGEIIAGDTGPGCGMLDSWVQMTTGQSFDRDGQIALKGVINLEMVDRALEHSYFKMAMPKSADRFEFNDTIDLSSFGPADGAATLCALTAFAIADAVRNIGSPQVTWVTGGGSKHPLIMQLLASRLGDVRPIEEYGLRSDSMEAECFAWLAVRRLHRLPTSLPSTTGCSHPVCGGTVSQP